MEFPQRVYSTNYQGSIEYTGQTQLLELQVPLGAYVELLRFWVTPDLTPGGPSFEEARIQIGASTTPATGGSSLTINELQGGGDPASACTAIRGGNPGTTNVIQHRAFSFRNGFQWVLHPDERVMLTSNASDPGDNLTIMLLHFTFEDWNSVRLNCGLIWRELS